MPITLINYSVTVTGKQERAELGTTVVANGSPTPTPRETRRVFLPAEREWAEVPIYAEEAFAPGQGADGPAIIDESDTTIYVPPGNRIERDEYMNYVLTR